MTDMNTFKDTFTSRKVKAEAKAEMLSDGIPSDQIEEIKDEEGNVTHVRRAPVDYTASIPTIETFLSDEKGLNVIQTLVTNKAKEMARKLFDANESLEGLTFSVGDFADTLTKTRKATKRAKVTNAQLSEVVKLFAQFLIDSGRKESTAAVIVNYMRQRFAPEVMTSLKPEVLEKLTSILVEFAEDMEDHYQEKYSHVIELLAENLEAAVDYEPVELSLDEL